MGSHEFDQEYEDDESSVNCSWEIIELGSHQLDLKYQNNNGFVHNIFKKYNEIET